MTCPMTNKIVTIKKCLVTCEYLCQDIINDQSSKVEYPHWCGNCISCHLKVDKDKIPGSYCEQKHRWVALVGGNCRRFRMKNEKPHYIIEKER